MAAQRTAFLLTDDRTAFASTISPVTGATMAVEEADLFIQQQWRYEFQTLLFHLGVSKNVREFRRQISLVLLRS